MRRFSLLNLAAGLSLMLVAGCKTYPNGPASPPVVSDAGDYVGSGNLGPNGSTINVSLGITGPDSLGHFAGQIGYGGAVTALTSVTKDSSGDTLGFQYARDNVQHMAWALADVTGLSVHFTQPAGIAAFRVNRELNSYNLSGIWQGVMYSNGLIERRTASMTIGQEGSLFIGTLDVNLGQNAHVQIGSGGYSTSSFQLTGTMHYSVTDYPFTAAGGYVSRDSISGNWTAGENGSFDSGTFDFRRSF